jgi:DNA topoisomerase VI subunit B
VDTLVDDPLRRAPKPGQLQRVTFRTSRLLDFCSVKELTAQTGHPPEQWPLVIVKELVDNALDACERSGVAPEVAITVDDCGIKVADNGPGIAAKTIGDILDYNVRVSSNEAYASPTRGAQGNALKTILAMPYSLHGELGEVTIESQGVRHDIKFAVDRIRQEPAITADQGPAGQIVGTSVRVWWPDLACSILTDAKARFLQIADDFTWLNPHLTLTLDSFGESMVVSATTPQWKKWKPSEPTSPYWYEPQHLERLIGAYLTHDRDTGRERTVREFVTEFQGLTGTAKQKAVLKATGLTREPLSRFDMGGNIDMALVGSLLSAMQANSRPVNPKRLGIIGEAHLRARFEAIGCQMESLKYKKVLKTTDNMPTVIETAFGWVPTAANRRLVTGVNWSPGIVNPFRHLGKHGSSLDTFLERQRVASDDPVITVVHMACPRVQYTDRGKSAVVLS